MRAALTAFELLVTVAIGHAESIYKFCNGVGQWAETIMKVRQVNAPISELLEGLTNDRMRVIVQYAYEKQAYMSPEMQTMAVREFRNEVESDCYKGNWSE